MSASRSRRARSGGSRRRLLAFLVPLLFLVGFQPPSRAVSNFTFYADVTSSATTDCTPIAGSCTGNCTTPTCGTQAVPCHEIQKAINIANCTIGTNAALEADILVTQGTYLERLFIYPNVHVIGAGRDVTTVDAVGQSRSAVTFSEAGFGFGRPKVKFSITGFRLIHGSGDRIMLNGPTGTFFEMGGGGVSIFGDAMVTDCRIEDNVMANNTGLTADNWNGAGIGVYSGAPIISGNLIQRNITTPPNLNGQDMAMGWGAGIFSRVDTRSVITHNVIRQNVALAQDAAGAGVNVDLGQAGTILSNNLIVANSASTDNGGLCLYGNDVAVYNNLVMGNVAGDAGGGVAVAPQVGHVNLTNNTIVGNVLTVHTVPKGAIFSSAGGGVYASFLSASPPPTPLIHLTNNLVAQNDTTSLGGGGGLFIYRSNPSNDHEDYFGDIPNEIRSDVTGYTGGDIFGSNGNISLSPVFVNAPVFWDHTNVAGTATTAVVFDSTRYVVGNRIEYNDDGVARQITAINSSTKTLTFNPALSVGTTAALRILANWGTNTNVTEDLRLTASSPLRDAGTNTGAPAVDLDDLPRPTDGDLNGSVITDIGAYEFRFPDSDGDGVADSQDCAPLVNSAWAVPGEVPAPVGMSSSQILSWSRIPQVNVYNVYSGTIASPFAYNQTCLIAEVPGLSASTLVGPPPGSDSGYFYLVGGVNFCGHGILHSNPTVQAIPACSSQGQDTDSDGVTNLNDNCPLVSNATQADPDHDTVGTACDNCPTLYNPSQLDVNSNNIGDHCEDADNDTYPLTVDCNDNNPAIHPGAVEVCNGLDDNCVNGVDEGGDALCNDSNLCTQDLCGGTSGCLNLPVVCPPAPDTCHDPGTCNPASGLCGSPTPKPDNSPCSDGNACTSPDTCQGAVCQAGPPTDMDGDTHVASACGGDDCNDANVQVWLVPFEVSNLTLTTASPANPSWDSQGSLVGPETNYDLVSGSLGPLTGFSFSTGTCLQPSGPSNYTDTRPDPAVDTGFWYLARARNSCGIGTYGSPARDAATTACP